MKDHHGYRLLPVTAVLAIGLPAAAGGSDPAWTLNGPSNAVTAGIGVFGTEFTVTAPVVVTDVGWYDNPLTPVGLVASHEVGIFDADTQELLVSGVVPSGTAGNPLGGFFYVAVTETSLVPERTYVVAGVRAGVDETRNVTPGSSMLEHDVVDTTRWVASFSGAGLVFPDVEFTTVTRSMGPNFLLVVACPWDFAPGGGDGVVGIQDFLTLLAQWPPAETWRHSLHVISLDFPQGS